MSSSICPHSHQQLTLLAPDIVEAINQDITLINWQGGALACKLSAHGSIISFL